MKSLELDPAFTARTTALHRTGAAGLSGLAFTALLLTPAVQTWFIEHGERWLYILLLAFWISLALTPIAGWAGQLWGLVDVPTARKIHQRATPRTGGFAPYVALLVALLMNSILPGWVTGLLWFFTGGLLLVGALVDLVLIPGMVQVENLSRRLVQSAADARRLHNELAHRAA